MTSMRDGLQGDIAVLRICLTGAVPLRIEQLKRIGAAKRAVVGESWARDALDPLASEGDGMLRKTPELPDEPGTAKTFNHLARAIAALAFTAGGVPFVGLIWCAEHSPSGAVGTSLCAECALEGDIT